MLRIRTIAFAALFSSMIFVPVIAHEGPSVTVHDLDTAKNCVAFDNLGTNNPRLINPCATDRTVRVLNYDADGKQVADRIFHMASRTFGKGARPIKMPGVTMFIDWEKGWMNEGGDDGSSFLSVTHHNANGAEVWEVRNTSADRYNAFSLKVIENGRHTMDVITALPPGQTGKMFAFMPGEPGAVIVDWSRLDPL